MTKSLIIAIFFLVMSIALLSTSAEKSAKNQQLMKKKIIRPPLADTSIEMDKVITLGHLGIYHIILNVWSLAYSVDVEEGLNYNKLFDGIEKALAKKPRFESMYILSCTIAFRSKHPERCLKMTEYGLSLFPVSWRITMTQGYVSYFEMNNLAEGALFYNLASTNHHAPPYVARVARKLYDRSELSESEILMLRDEMSKIIKDFKDVRIVKHTVLDDKSKEIDSNTDNLNNEKLNLDEN